MVGPAHAARIALLALATSCMGAFAPIQQHAGPRAAVHPDAIVQADIAKARLDDRSAYDAIRHLAPLMLVERPGMPGSSGLAVFIDGAPFTLDALRAMPAREIESAERLSGPEARARFGSNAGLDDAVVIQTRRGDG